MPSFSVISGWTGREMNLSTLLLCSKPAWFTLPLLSLAFIFWGSNAAGGLFILYSVGACFCQLLTFLCPSSLSEVPGPLSSVCYMTAWSSGIRWLIVHPKPFLDFLFLWLHGVYQRGPLASVGFLSTQSLFLSACFCDCMVWFLSWNFHCVHLSGLQSSVGWLSFWSVCLPACFFGCMETFLSINFHCVPNCLVGWT